MALPLLEAFASSVFDFASRCHSSSPIVTVEMKRMPSNVNQARKVNGSVATLTASATKALAAQGPPQGLVCATTGLRPQRAASMIRSFMLRRSALIVQYDIKRSASDHLPGRQVGIVSDRIAPSSLVCATGG